MNDTYDQEINLKDLLFYILHKWRLIISVAVLFGLLLGGYKFTKSLADHQNKEYSLKLEEQYQSDLEKYEQSLSSLESNIENMTADIEYQEAYQENSLLFQIDPYNKQMASADVFITLDNNTFQGGITVLSADPADSIVKAYSSSIQRGKFLLPLSEKNNVDLSYLKELIQVSPDYNGNMLTINVVHKDKESAEELLDLVLKNLEALKPEVQSQLGLHGISIMNQGSSSVIDTDLASNQKNKVDNLTNLRQSLKEIEKEKADLKAPEKPNALSKRGIIKSGIKYGILGGVLGVFITAFVICILFLMSDILYSVEDLKKRIGVNILGVFSIQRKKRFLTLIDDWLDRLEGRQNIDDQEVYERITANVMNFSEKNSKVLLTGTIDETALNDLGIRLQEKFSGIELTVSPDINVNTSTLKILPEYDGVIFAEKKGVSKCGQVTKEIEIVNNFKKSVIGCIIL